MVDTSVNYLSKASTHNTIIQSQKLLIDVASDILAHVRVVGEIWSSRRGLSNSGTLDKRIGWIADLSLPYKE